ncbi:CDP-alcohol phosphatidyltransferase family protein [Kocuria sp.]|jgi:phosphatidylglycerophosphate synthase|uniref:CDP-alcohol phosphatidyltransferase family protein n=1 Tax=Kocuria sp. TaxID=1871328 RepID=UPI002810F612|nr:CDP-alcohol phosphatidyltransferase family protein [Kocuria sp.]HST71991.1 CDP-alcohol phosphatidyltransferase family protein [Kocuria rosea]
MPLARPAAPRSSARRDGLAAVLATAAAVVLLALVTGAGAPVAAASAVLGLAVTGAVVRSTVRRRDEPYGPADRVTVARSVLVAVAAALLPLGLAPGPAQDALRPAAAWCWGLFAVALPAWLLDALDGRVARRTGTATRAGARFDQEVDAALILVLSVAVAARIGLPGAAWVLVIGALRYLFLLALRLRPAWRRPLPPSGYRRTTAGIQGGVLLGALLPLVPLPLAAGAVALALALLLVSFGRDVVWLRRRARP